MTAIITRKEVQRRQLGRFSSWKLASFTIKFWHSEDTSRVFSRFNFMHLHYGQNVIVARDVDKHLRFTK